MKIDAYRQFTSESEIEYIKKLGGFLKGYSANVVSTAWLGGGVAELLNGVMPFLEEFDYDLRRVNPAADDAYLRLCKKFYEGLSDASVPITRSDIDLFLSYGDYVKEQIKKPCDLLFVHDHAGLLSVEKKNYKKAVWRCHVDASHANLFLWNFLKTYIDRCDGAAFSFPGFSGEIKTRKYSLMPAIDPLSDKNKELPREYINGVFEKYKIRRDKPVIAQYGRFDVLKDPLGVLDVFAEVKKDFDCTLVLAGGNAKDDPDGEDVYKQAAERARGIPDANVILMEHNDLEINALQRGADIILQKSVRESFGLAITEALWKKKPVVASETGGIPLQIIEGHTGFLSVSNASCVSQIKKLLKDPRLGAELGLGGYKHVRENFLVTRHVRDLLIMFCSILGLDF